MCLSGEMSHEMETPFSDPRDFVYGEEGLNFPRKAHRRASTNRLAGGQHGLSAGGSFSGDHFQRGR